MANKFYGDRHIQYSLSEDNQDRRKTVSQLEKETDKKIIEDIDQRIINQNKINQENQVA